MNRRNFINLLVAAAAGVAISPALSAADPAFKQGRQTGKSITTQTFDEYTVGIDWGAGHDFAACHILILKWINQFIIADQHLDRYVGWYEPRETIKDLTLSQPVRCYGDEHSRMHYSVGRLEASWNEGPKIPVHSVYVVDKPEDLRPVVERLLKCYDMLCCASNHPESLSLILPQVTLDELSQKYGIKQV